MNDIKLLVRLTKSPEIQQSQGGHAYAWFTIAVPRVNNRDEADFFRCVVFDKLAQALVINCSKGRQLLVQGRVEVSTKKDQQTQNLTTYHTVIASSIEFLQKPNPQATQA